MKNNEEVLDLIIKNSKSLKAFYTYPTAGCGDVIAETSIHNGKEFDHNLKNLINLTVQLGAAAAGCGNDNKIAVKVIVDQLDYPVYFCKKDGRYCITKDVNAMDKQEPIKINWSLEH